MCDTEIGRPRICIVDDDVSVLAMLSELLDSDFEVIAARGGREEIGRAHV